VVFAVFFF